MSVPSGASLDKITALSKRRGFVYATSDIYGGLASSYDYGPLGAELLRNIRNLWWHDMITTREDMIGLDTQILLHPETWVASGHVNAFNDPLVEDKVTFLTNGRRRGSPPCLNNDCENAENPANAFLIWHSESPDDRRACLRENRAVSCHRVCRSSSRP